MLIHFNHPLSGGVPDNKVWQASNGATRRTLVVVNKTFEGLDNAECLRCSVGFLDKGNHSFIFLNPPRKENDGRTLGIYLCSGYGYRMIKGKELYTSSSIGGYGNSESKFGIYELGTVIAEDSYKSRQGEIFYKLTPEGWECLGNDIPLDEAEITEI